MTYIVIVDIDNTLCNDIPYNTLEEFHDSVVNGESVPRDWMVSHLTWLQDEGCDLIFITARNESLREATETMLNQYFKVYELFMRPANNLMTSKELKPYLINQNGINKKAILFAVEDDEDTLKAYTANGIKCYSPDEFKDHILFA